VAKSALRGIDQTDFPIHHHFLYLDLTEDALRQLLGHAHARQEATPSLRWTILRIASTVGISRSMLRGTLLR